MKLDANSIQMLLGAVAVVVGLAGLLSSKTPAPGVGSNSSDDLDANVTGSLVRIISLAFIVVGIISLFLGIFALSPR